MQRVELLLNNGVTPLVVFDGGRLPMKAEEETTRRRCQQYILLVSSHSYTVTDVC
jgi:hypothetical protein